jgi:hypothetical protein
VEFGKQDLLTSSYQVSDGDVEKDDSLVPRGVFGRELVLDILGVFVKLSLSVREDE